MTKSAPPPCPWWVWETGRCCVRVLLVELGPLVVDQPDERADPCEEPSVGDEREADECEREGGGLVAGEAVHGYSSAGVLTLPPAVRPR